MPVDRAATSALDTLARSLLNDYVKRSALSPSLVRPGDSFVLKGEFAKAMSEEKRTC